MEVRGRGPRGEAPWKKLSKEELENQYSPSRWVIRRGAEETLRMYSRIGEDASPFCLFFHGGFWQSGRHCAEEGGMPRLKKSVMRITLKSFGT
uniref:Arylformamidase n=1 Tax=Ailuropoda melanoleuca TaxID=9646 RepID=A0A7N5P487_AILME